MATTNIRSILLLIVCLAGASARSQFIISPAETHCNLIVTGGSHYRYLDPEYDSKYIYSYDLNGNVNFQKSVYSAGANYLEYPKLALSCGYIAVREHNRVTGTWDARIVTTAGEEKLLLPKVLRFEWGLNARGEDVLAYLAGEYPTEEDESEFPPSGEVWMLNITTDERWMIHPNGFQVTWAEFDSSFYIEETHGPKQEIRVSRYDLTNRRLEETPYLGSTFSRGGTYYYLSDYEIASFMLYERSSNENIAHEYAELLACLDSGLISPVGWISDTMLALSSRSAKAKDERATQQIIDFKGKQLWEVKPAIVGLTGPNGRDLIQLTKEGVTVRPFKDVAKLVYPQQIEVTVEVEKK